jgi:hypothetical protein
VRHSRCLFPRMRCLTSPCQLTSCASTIAIYKPTASPPPSVALPEIDLSFCPPKCTHCVLGKQTQFPAVSPCAQLRPRSMSRECPAASSAAASTHRPDSSSFHFTCRSHDTFHHTFQMVSTTSHNPQKCVRVVLCHRWRTVTGVRSG